MSLAPHAITPEFATFARDDQFDYAAIWHVKASYLAAGLMSHSIAIASGYRSISKETRERWMRVLALTYLLDQLIDDQPTERQDEADRWFLRILREPLLTTEELPEWIEPGIIDTVGLLRNAMAELGPTSWEELVQAGIDSKELAKEKAETDSLLRYRHLLIREGKLTARFFLACMDPQERRQYWRFHQYRSALEFFVITAVIVDHWKDFQCDYEAGRTRVPPTQEHRRALLAFAFGEMARVLPYPRLVLLCLNLKWGAWYPKAAFVAVRTTKARQRALIGKNIGSGSL